MKHAFIRWGNFSWPLIMGAAAFLFAIGSGGNLLNDGDTYWHIATGRWILESGAIPYEDPFSHTFLGAPWTAHEWLSEVFLYLAFKLAGWHGVAMLGALAFSAALAYLTRFLLRYVEPIHALLFSVLALGMAATHLLARPHLLAMPFLVIWVAGLIRAREEGRSPSYWLLGSMIVWANLHGGFTLGIALTAAFGMEAVLNAKGKSERIVVARRWFLFLMLASLAGMLTPNGIEGVFFTAKVLGMSTALANISEWRSPNFQKFQFLELWLMLLIFGALTKGFRLPLVRLAILLALIHLALSHSRNVAVLGLLSPLLLAPSVSTQWTARLNYGSVVGKLDSFFIRHAQPATPSAIGIMLVLLGTMSFYMARQGKIKPPENRHPVAAIQAIKELGIKGHVFNQYGFGGYLIFSGVPVFIDGRADMYGSDFLGRYIGAYRHPQTNDLGSLLGKYHVSWTLLQPETSAATFMDHLPGWRRVYRDETAVVHVRNIENNLLP